LSVSVGYDEKVGDGSFVPLAIDTDRREPVSAVNDRIVIELNGMVLKLLSVLRGPYDRRGCQPEHRPTPAPAPIRIDTS
jgi:hypothetical protein